MKVSSDPYDEPKEWIDRNSCAWLEAKKYGKRFYLVTEKPYFETLVVVSHNAYWNSRILMRSDVKRFYTAVHSVVPGKCIIYKLHEDDRIQER